MAGEPSVAPGLCMGAVTYQRPRALLGAVRSLLEQTVLPEVLVVVDNDPATGAQDALRELEGTAPFRIVYLPQPENVGPAGAIATAVRWLRQHPGPWDWFVLLDDMVPIPRTDALAASFGAALRAAAEDPRVGAVGVGGAVLDRRSGRLRRLGDDQLEGFVSVTYLGAGDLPAFRFPALADAIEGTDELFFGFEELALCLNLQRADHRVVVDGPRALEARAQKGRLGIEVRPSARAVLPAWRAYYSVRNLIWLLRKEGWVWGAATVTVWSGVLKAFLTLVTDPRHGPRYAEACWCGVLDGWRGRMGRRFVPDYRAQDLPDRGGSEEFDVAQ